MKKKIIIIVSFILIISSPYLYNLIKLYGNLRFEVASINKSLRDFDLDKVDFSLMKNIKTIKKDNQYVYDLPDLSVTDDVSALSFIKNNRNLKGYVYKSIKDVDNKQIYFMKLNNTTFDKNKINEFLDDRLEKQKEEIKKSLKHELSITRRQVLSHKGNKNGYDYLYFVNYAPLPANSWDERESYLYIYNDNLFVLIISQQIGSNDLGGDNLNDFWNEMS